MGWLNGVTICGEKGAYFREGMIEDYITMNTGIAYPVKYTAETNQVKFVLHWFRQIFPDDELFEYFLKDSASLLYGKNSEKMFRMWIGKAGNNSKSMLIKLITKTLGEYCVTFPTTILCKSFNSDSGLNPALAQVKGAHLGIISEADETDEIMGGKLKRMTGGDDMFARGCGDNGGAIQAFYKLIYMANEVPPILGLDKAIEDRLAYLPFLSVWSMDAPETEAEQFKLRTFKMDYSFDEKIPSLCSAFAWIMLNNFSKYKIEKLRKPKIVIEYTQQYWKDNDPYRTFIIDVLELDENNEFNTSDLYPHFKAWYGNNFPQTKTPISKIFTKIMQETTHLGPLNEDRKWIGYRIKE